MPIIQLVNPIEGPSGPIATIELREPKFRDLMLLGEPAAYARGDDGALFQIEKDDVVQAYIERLMIEPKDRAVLAQVSLADALQLREVVFGFFEEARKAISARS